MAQSRRGESQTVQELRQFEKDVSTGLQRIIDTMEAREAEINQLALENQQKEAELNARNREAQALARQAQEAEQKADQLDQQVRQIADQNRRLADRQAATEAQEAAQRQNAEHLQRQLAALEARVADKERETGQLERQVADLTDRAANAEAEVGKIRQKAMAAFAGGDYVDAGSFLTPTNKRTSGMAGTPMSGGTLGRADIFTFGPNSTLNGEPVITPGAMSGTSSVPMTPNIFAQTLDFAGSTFAPGQGLTCTPEYLHQAVLAYNSRLNELKQAVDVTADHDDEENFERLGRALKAYVDESRRTMLALSCIPPGSDINQYDDLQAKARQLQDETTRLARATALQGTLTGAEAEQQRRRVLSAADQCQTTTSATLRIVQQMLPHGDDMNPNDMAALLAREMDQMHSAVAGAISKLEDIQQKAHASDKEGWKLEVDDRILAACKQLAMAIQEITEAAAALQQEIERAEKGALSTTEFYKRNARWTQGLISSAKEITEASIGFVKAADDAITHGKLAEAIVWTQEVSAATIRLAVSSRVKAPKNSRAIGDVMQGTRNVSQATAAVVLQIRQSIELMKQQEAQQQQSFEKYLDTLGFYETNKLEMESKIKAQQLEAELEKEQGRLRALRKRHANLVGGDEAKKLEAQMSMEASLRKTVNPNSTSGLARQMLSTTSPDDLPGSYNGMQSTYKTGGYH